MKLSLNLTTAMSLRNQLNQFVLELKSKLQSSVCADPDEFEQFETNYLTGSWDGDFALYVRGLLALANLKRKIEENESTNCFDFVLDDEIQERI